ncbi:hypothetical protein V6N13_068280 [Hibiscus sabdariffa]
MSESQGQGTQSSQSSSPSKVIGPTLTRNESIRKQQQPRASCWSHFSKYVTEDGQKRARCNHCDTTYTMETGGSTTSLNNHMKVCLQKPKGNTSDLKQSELSFANVGDGPESEKTIFSTWKFDRYAIRKALIHMIVVDELPFGIVEGEGFKQFLSIACPSTLDDDEWKLQKRIINFCLISAHRGKSIGQALEKCIRDWGIERVFTITVDNASANGVGIAYLRKKLSHRNTCVANGKYMHMRCVAHIINLIVQEGVKYVSMSVDRVRAVVRYIRASPLRMKRFYDREKEEMIDTKTRLQLDAPTRWNSTYMMLDVAAKYEHAFDSYARDDNSFFLDLIVRDGVPTFDNWENIQRIVKILQSFYDLTLKVSRSLHVTAYCFWETLIEIHCLLDEWLNCDDLDIVSMASKMKDKYNKYWGDATNINFMVYLAIILDPRRKMGYNDFSLMLPVRL